VVFNLAGIPLFNQDEGGNPPARVLELKAAVREADAILLVTPEYNYSIPGVLKNAIDWASRPSGDSPGREAGPGHGRFSWCAWQRPRPISSASMLRFLNMHAVNRTK